MQCRNTKGPLGVLKQARATLCRDVRPSVTRVLLTWKKEKKQTSLVTEACFWLTRRLKPPHFPPSVCLFCRFFVRIARKKVIIKNPYANTSSSAHYLFSFAALSSSDVSSTSSPLSAILSHVRASTFTTKPASMVFGGMPRRTKETNQRKGMLGGASSSSSFPLSSSPRPSTGFFFPLPLPLSRPRWMGCGIRKVYVG